MRPRASICAPLFTLLVLAAPAWAAQVQVCHVPPGNPGNFHTITISDNALQAHLGHGDLVGACSAHCGQLCDDGNACTIDACDASERCLTTHPPVDCDDGNLCTTDTCNPVSGCASAPKICQDSDLCSVDSCDPLTGNCVFPPAACPTGQTCNPGNGSCENQAVTCPCSSLQHFDSLLTLADSCLANDPILGMRLQRGELNHALISFSNANATPQPQCGFINTNSGQDILTITAAEAAFCAQRLLEGAASLGLGSCESNGCTPPNPCQHSGTCQASSGGYTCTCASGWTGTNCEQDIDECAAVPSPCGEDACLNFPGSYECGILEEL